LKFLEQGMSQDPPETVDTSGLEPLKRLRDEVDGDDNPRETKLPVVLSVAYSRALNISLPNYYT